MDPLWPESIILGIAAMACVRADGRRGAGHAWLGRGWGRHIYGVTDFLLYVPANAVPWSRPAVRPARSAAGHLRRGGHRARFHWLRPAHPGGQSPGLRRAGRTRRARRTLAYQRGPAARPAPVRLADPAAQPPVRRYGRGHAGLVRRQAAGRGGRAAMDIRRGEVLLRPGKRPDKGPAGAGRTLRLARLDSAQDKHRAVDKPGHHPGPAARCAAETSLHAGPAPVRRRRPAAAGPPAGERRDQRTGPVSRLRVPARLPQAADLPVPAVGAPLAAGQYATVKTST